MIHKLASRLNQISQWEHSWCEPFNRISHYLLVRWLFRAVSRLGNGIFWYSLMLALPLVYGPAAWQAVIHMIVAGLTCTAIYKWLKSGTERPRPFQLNHNLYISTHPLDQYSFPSGHTLHATAFSIVLLNYYPELAWLIAPFTALVALSRLVLGLHYPTDVLAGAAIGTLVSGLSLLLWN